MNTAEETTVQRLLELPMVSPRDFALPHDVWRDNQFETIQYLSGVKDGRVVILSAPTGSGKTSLSKAMAKYGGVTTLVKTKGLQVENYGKTYEFDVLFGRGNYDCIHPEKEPMARADACLYEDRMQECDLFSQCPYVMQKHLVQESMVRSLNYSYFLTASWPRESDYATKYLFLDECHNLPDETLEFVSCTIKEGDRIKWRLPEFPSVYDSSKDSVEACRKWLSRAAAILYKTAAELKKEKDAHSKAKRSKAIRLMSKFYHTSEAIEAAPTDWYSRSGLRALEFNGNKIPGMVVKPLTARHHFGRLFLGMYPRTVLMSATVGNHMDFAEELGIDPAAYDFHQIPNSWPPESRPVHVADVPSMGQKATESMRQKQAETMAKAINDLPGDWSGIIHVTSWNQAWDVRKRLVKAGVKSGRLFIPDRGGTNKQIEQWNYVRDGGEGMLVITPSMNAGVDLQKERICIIAKVPWGFTSPGTYDDERRRYSNKFYRWQTASDLEQRCGRTRRGKSEDYDDSFSIRGYVGIFDGSFQRMGLGKSCSLDFVDSLVFDK